MDISQTFRENIVQCIVTALDEGKNQNMEYLKVASILGAGLSEAAALSVLSIVGPAIELLKPEEIAALRKIYLDACERAWDVALEADGTLT
jgi:hypothetical protein